MKQRIITALVGLVVLGAVLAFYETIVLDAVVAVLILLAVYELLHACGCLAHRAFTGFLMLSAVAVPLFPAGVLARYAALLFLIYVFCMFCFMLANHSRLAADRAGFAAFYTLLISLSAGCIVWMRDQFGYVVGLYALLVTLLAAWVSDTGAYFAGVFFGKHKLCPEISPKKTIEGVFGGVIAAVLAQALAAVGFSYAAHTEIPWIFVIVSPLLTGISIMGDLSASLVKRRFGIKDFSNLMPGHGGILDRFDSVLPLLPAVYLLFCYRHPITFL